MDILGSENINESLQTHFLIYKITNNVNGKYYIGQHKTDNPYDDYMGSGDIIQAAIHKHSLSCFTKEILFDFDNFEDMNNKEKELVPLSACYPYNPMSYNLREGGYNGQVTIETRKKMSISAKQRVTNYTKDELENFNKARSHPGKLNPGYKKYPYRNKSKEWINEYKKYKSEICKGKNNPNFKYPYKLVVQMRDEYNKTGYDGVKKKFGYTATVDKLRGLFIRNNLDYRRFNRRQTESII